MRRLFRKYQPRLSVALLIWCCLLLLLEPSVAAPLPTGNPQARDAVALLREWGLVDGYPNQGFKGDRAVSRYEAAMILARTLASLEQRHHNFTDRQQLSELQRLQSEFASELEMLVTQEMARSDFSDSSSNILTRTSRLTIPFRALSTPSRSLR